MLTYNTALPQLKLPEYGRTIQSMVDGCMAIADRQERTRCAYAIIKAMSILFPKVGNEDPEKRVLWDHLAFMSNFQLDIDWPFEVLAPGQIESTPEKVRMDTTPMLSRQYGKNIERMIYIASQMPEGEDRWALVTLIASQMKKMMLNSNRDGVADEKIFQDLCDMSQGILNINPADMPLHEFKHTPAPAKKKKKK